MAGLWMCWKFMHTWSLELLLGWYLYFKPINHLETHIKQAWGDRAGRSLREGPVLRNGLLQALGAILPPGPFDGSPVLCYAQKPLAAATLQDTSMDCMESGHPMGQNLVIMVSPFGGCNQFCDYGYVKRYCHTLRRFWDIGCYKSYANNGLCLPYVTSIARCTFIWIWLAQTLSEECSEIIMCIPSLDIL